MIAPATNTQSDSARHTTKVVSLLTIGVSALVGGGAWCVVVSRGLDTGHHGMSVYGVSAGSAVPFAAALLLAATFIHLAAFRLAPAEKWLARPLQAVAFLLIGVLVVPMSPRVVPGIAHSALGTSLFIAQLIVGARLVSRSQTARLFLQAALAIQFCGCAISLLALLDLSDTMFAGQVVTQLAWAPLVVLGTANALRPHLPASSHHGHAGHA